jgi:SAM-dependent methyltransferase
VPASVRPPIIIECPWGIGDNLQCRAVFRELKKTNSIWLKARNVAMFHDLIGDGVNIITHGGARIREGFQCPTSAAPSNAATKRIDYRHPEIARHGSILAAQFSSVGLQMPAKPDFSLPILPAWRDKALALIRSWNIGERPLMVYRPIILNTGWSCPSRSPDPAAYAALFQSIRPQFFVASIADLKPGKEWIVGPEQDADVKLHSGELDFETMAALFAEADLAFGNAGFFPVMALAVGTPAITVYGGHESSKTTQAPARHLAPSLFIEPDQPCDCHAFDHACDKTISLEPAKARIRDFVAANVRPLLRTLIVVTCYVDSAHRARLFDHCLTLTRKRNADCDLLVVDSHSPLCPGVAKLIADKHGAFLPYSGTPARQMVYSFPDNVGHLSRKGRDGWGRAFCYGLDAAVQAGYDYVVHIEGDSLFRLPVLPIVRQMRRQKIAVQSIPVLGTKYEMRGWVETGLMFFSTEFLVESKLTQRYDWPNRRESPSPEAVVRGLCGDKLQMASWKAWRGDKNQITADNIAELNLDWVTHCWDNDPVYDRFLEVSLNEANSPRRVVAIAAPLKSPGLKINLGCGSNKLDGWQNFDSQIDISKPLPFPENSADYIFAEHVVEHVDYYGAIAFFKECHRVIKPCGVVRIAVPSLESIRNKGDAEYFGFTTKWQKVGATARGAMHAILYAHGHKMAWTQSLLETTLFYAGFDQLAAARPGESEHQALRGVEGHHKVIGKKFNDIETVIIEGTVVS